MPRPPQTPVHPPRSRRWVALVASGSLAAALFAGCGVLQTQQRKWIFQATPAPQTSADVLARDAASWGMESVWIEHASASAGRPVRLHALWAPHDDASAPVALYLHGVRRDIARNTYRMAQLRSLGFSVLAIDYRGFGNSTDVLPSEVGVLEDAAAAWRWLAAHHGDRHRYIYGHSLGGAIGVQLAASLADAPPSLAPRGVVVEGTFTSIADVLSTMRWGWLPVRMLITERFDSLAAVSRVKASLLVVHGSEDTLVPSRFGRQLYERATAPKRFVLVDGATHSNSAWRGEAQLRAAMRDFFGLGAGADRPGTAGSG